MTTDNLEKRVEIDPNANVDRVITAKGSEYHYLPNGQTQRFKKVEGKWYEPQDLLVYVPDFEWVQKSCPAEWKNRFGENKIQYEQMLLEYVHNPGNGNKKAVIVDDKGNRIETNREAYAASTKGKVLFAMLENEKAVLYVPVSVTPKLGLSTFDCRTYQKNGQWMRSKHLGNKVVEIIYKKQPKREERR